jgi:cellulose synthase/poly-beta-1,6-N-acetylglucosamine synthase-like glycosyltransferase
MEILPFVYLAYMFVSFYFLILTLLLYFKNKKYLFFYPKPTKFYDVSVIVPVFNEEKTISKTLEYIFGINYKNLKKVFVVNDGSKDNTLQILKSLQPIYGRRLEIINKKNSGKADSVNYALKFVKTELVAVVDADSYPEKDSLLKMVGFFDDAEVGAVTPSCTPRNKVKFIENMQDLEYRVIAFTRKLLEFIESIYVVTGTLGLYRKKALDDIGGFDKENITEDIEATWHLISKGWKVRMSLDARITTEVPSNIRPWFIQRRRWAIGGLQCIIKYRHYFFKKGILGIFIVPFFTLGLILGLLGMVIFSYVSVKRIISYYLTMKYSVSIEAPILTLDRLYFSPSVLNYFGIVLFVLFLLFNLYVLAVIKDNVKKQSFFNLLFYMTIYLLVYPITLIEAIRHLLEGKKIWR